MQVHKNLYTVILTLCNNCGTGKALELGKRFIKLFIILKIEMCPQQVMKPFYKMCCFHFNHQRFLVKNINPFLRIPVIHQEVLFYKSIPAITLVEIQLFIKTADLLYIKRKMLFKKM